eukprot:jgi/Botrbrau1/17317/Bobra.0015s0065.1
MVLTRPLHAGHHPLKLLSLSGSVATQKKRFWLLVGGVAAVVALKLTKSIRHRLLTALWDSFSWLFEEFEPWLKWLLLDSILTLAVGVLSKQLPSSRKVFRAIGWL